MDTKLGRAFRSLLLALVDVRLCGPESIPEYQRFGRFGSVQGQLRALEDLGVITWDQLCLLTDLLLNASKHSGEPFPSALNIGPVMPPIIALERRLLSQSGDRDCDCTDGCDACDDDWFAYRVGKPLARLPAYEQQVPAPAPHTGLRLLCLLVTSRTGETRSLPVHTMRPMPPAVLRLGRWSLASDPAFVLRETQAIRPTAEVLARYSRQRQSNAVCADLRTVRTGGVSQ